MKVTDRRAVGKTGLTVTALGLGTAAFGGLYRTAASADARSALAAAWDRGIRYFDTAPMYGLGRAEHFLGDLLRDVDPDAQSSILSTKVGRLCVAPRPGRSPEPAPGNPFDSGWHSALRFSEVFDYSYDGILRSFDDSQQRLGRPEIDLLFIHDIGSATHGPRNVLHWDKLRAGGFRALEELRNAGLIRGFGLGVNECDVIDAAMTETDMDCCLLAGRYSLLDRQATDLLNRMHQRGIAVIAGGVFNSGILAGGDQKYNYLDAPADVVARVDRLRALCDAHGVPLGAPAIQFATRHPAIAAVLVGARDAANVAECVDWFETPVPDTLWQALDTA